MLNQETVDKLNQPIANERIHVRSQGPISVRYLEGYDIIDTANIIFGYDGWQDDTESVVLETMLGIPLVKAKVKVGIRNDEGEWIWRSDIGVCSVSGGKGGNYNPAAIEMAIKGAVTDGLKRCFRTFGSQFGNSLYDKDFANNNNQPAVNIQAATTQAPAYTPNVPASTGNPQPVRPGAASNGTTMECPDCGGTRTHKSGYNKNNKPYSGWFCENNCKPIWDPKE